MLACTLNRKPGHGTLFYEDALTSTVFERLGYFPPDLALQVLGIACPSFREQFGRSAPKFTVEFWPVLADVTGTQERVEPDVVIDLGHGLLIVEAKRPGGVQTVGQVTLEIEAVRNSVRYRDQEVLGVLLVEPVGVDDDQVAGVPVFRTRWVDIADAVQVIVARNHPPHVEAVLADLLDGLAGGGVSALRPLEGLVGCGLSGVADPVGFPAWSGA